MSKCLGIIPFLFIFGEGGGVCAEDLSGTTRWRVASESCIAHCEPVSSDPYRDMLGSPVTMTLDGFESKFTDACRGHVKFSPVRETHERLMSRFSHIYGPAFVKKNAEKLLEGRIVSTLTATCIDQSLDYEIAFLFNISDHSADILVEDGKVLHLEKMLP